MKDKEISKLVGRQPIAPELRRVNLVTRIDPCTLESLKRLRKANGISLGRIIDQWSTLHNHE